MNNAAPIEPSNVIPAVSAGNASVTPAGGGQGCSQCGSSAGQVANSAPAGWVYAIGRIVPRFPDLGVEKEFAQAGGGPGAADGMLETNRLIEILKDPQSRYLARQLCWVFHNGETEAFTLVCRDAAEVERLVDAMPRVESADQAIQVVVGSLGYAPADAPCAGAALPAVAVDHHLTFSMSSFIDALAAAEQGGGEKGSKAGAGKADETFRVAARESVRAPDAPFRQPRPDRRAQSAELRGFAVPANLSSGRRRAPRRQVARGRAGPSGARRRPPARGGAHGVPGSSHRHRGAVPVPGGRHGSISVPVHVNQSSVRLDRSEKTRATDGYPPALYGRAGAQPARRRRAARGEPVLPRSVLPDTLPAPVFRQPGLQGRSVHGWSHSISGEVLRGAGDCVPGDLPSAVRSHQADIPTHHVRLRMQEFSHQQSAGPLSSALAIRLCLLHVRVSDDTLPGPESSQPGDLRMRVPAALDRLQRHLPEPVDQRYELRQLWKRV